MPRVEAIIQIAEHLEPYLVEPADSVRIARALYDNHDFLAGSKMELPSYLSLTGEPLTFDLGFDVE